MIRPDGMGQCLYDGKPHLIAKSNEKGHTVMKLLFQILAVCHNNPPWFKNLN